MLRRRDAVDVAVRESTRLVREPRWFRDGVRATQVYLDDLLVGDDEAFAQRGGLVGGLLILVIALLPPLLVLRKVTRILEDYVVVANISDLKNRRTIEIVLRRQKTVAAFEALKVVQCLRDPKMLLRVVRTPRLHDHMRVYASRLCRRTQVGHQSIASPLSISSDDLSTKFTSPEQPKAKKSIALSESPPEDYQPTPETSSTPFAARKRLQQKKGATKRRHRASVAGLTQLRQEEADIYEARQRSQWRRIFDLFDDDGEGLIAAS
jgi:hypothetical protein